MKVLNVGNLHCCFWSVDREQMEHCADWSDDIFPRGRCQHSGTAGLARQMREQDTNSYKDRIELKDAKSIPACCVLHSERARRSWHVVDGSRSDSTI